MEYQEFGFFQSLLVGKDWSWKDGLGCIFAILAGNETPKFVFFPAQKTELTLQ